MRNKKWQGLALIFGGLFILTSFHLANGESFSFLQGKLGVYPTYARAGETIHFSVRTGPMPSGNQLRIRIKPRDSDGLLPDPPPETYISVMKNGAGTTLFQAVAVTTGSWVKQQAVLQVLQERDTSWTDLDTTEFTVSKY